MALQLAIISRMLTIVDRLKAPGCHVPTNDFVEYVNRSMSVRGYDEVSRRTIERDIAAIRELFGIDISNDKNGYYIREWDTFKQERYEQLLMNFDLLNALAQDTHLDSYVLAEHHRPLHSEWLPYLISAIRYSHPVKFHYTLPRQNGKVVEKNVHPYYLKESNQRWYLLAYDDEILKTFGVDRINNLEVKDNETFKRRELGDMQAYFKDCYGIWNDPCTPVEDVELKYDELDGSFLKSCPLHHSQQVLADTEDEFRIKVRLRITNDFVMELLSRSRSLEVISSLHLRERIRKIYEEALKRNQ